MPSTQFFRLPKLHRDDRLAIHFHVGWLNRPETSTCHLIDDFLGSWLCGIGWAAARFSARHHTLTRTSLAWERLGAWARMADDPRLAGVDWRAVSRGFDFGGGQGVWARSKLMRELRRHVGAICEEERRIGEMELEAAWGADNTFEDVRYELGEDRAVNLMKMQATVEAQSIIQAAKHFPIESVRLTAWVASGPARDQARMPSCWLDPRGGQSWECGGRSMQTIHTSKGLLVETSETSWYSDNLDYIPIDREDLQRMLPRNAPKMFGEPAPF